MLTGIFVPLITPFTPTGEVALEALERLANEVLDAGAAGLVALGTTGEPATLTGDERRAVVGCCARVCAERSAPLIVGAGTNTTDASVAALAELTGVTAALVTVPYFLRPSEEGVVAHFARLAAASPVPLVVYHVPYRTGRPLSAETLLRLAALPGVVGFKHAVGAIDADTVAMLAALPADFGVLGGDDLFIAPLLALGAAGGILASAHLATAEFAALADAWRTGDVARARPLGHRLATLSATLFAEPNPSVIKAVLHDQGRIPSPGVRLPLLTASPESLAAALKQLAA
jgi:4-hydroxy-tetrahydrodipicolinate synthase